MILIIYGIFCAESHIIIVLILTLSLCYYVRIILWLTLDYASVDFTFALSLTLASIYHRPSVCIVACADSVLASR